MPTSEIRSLGELVVSLLGLLTVLGLVFLLLQSLSRKPPQQPAPQKRAPRPLPRAHDDRLVAGDRRVGLSDTRRAARPGRSADADLVPVAAFGSASEANAVRDRLRAAGIASFLVGENAVREERSPLPGIELHVRQPDAEAALALLDEAAPPPLDEPETVQIPREKAGDLVTVATFDSLIEAQLAQARLETAGLRSQLADAQLIAMDWVLSNAVGGIKLQVLGVDAPAALRALAEPADTPLPENFDDLPDDEYDEPPNEREVAAERTAKAAILGLLLWPVQFYTALLLLGVWSSPLPLRPEYRGKAVAAACLALPFVVVMLLPVALVLWFLVAPRA